MLRPTTHPFSGFTKAFAWAGVLLTATATLLADAKPPVRVVYFIPSDRDPIPGQVERLDKVMTEVQSFYRKGMEAAGYGPLTFDLEREAGHKLVVHPVKGKLPARSYGRNDSMKVGEEVEAALVAQHLELGKRTTVIFQVLLEWKDGVATELGPYVGGGNAMEGVAWVYDDAMLDPGRLGSRDDGGYYGGRCSIGEFNSHYIGGVAHELGHAFGLPHVAGPESEPRHSLMGDGNHYYGEELRGEGPGTYLHPASAMLLSRCLPFAGSLSNSSSSGSCEFKELEAAAAEKQLLLKGRIEATPPAFGVISYNDPARTPGDYEAQGETSALDNSGNFKLAIAGLAPGDYELRLQVCHTNGATTTSSFRYRVGPGGAPDLKPFSPAAMLLREAALAYSQFDQRRVLELTDKLEQTAADSPELLRRGRHLRALLENKMPRAPRTVPLDRKSIAVSDLEFVLESVGWERPDRNKVPAPNGASCFLEVGGDFHERGLYAHAPSRYTLDLWGGWKRFSAGFGLQDGHDGSVVFVVKGDGRELFRSGKITGHQSRQTNLDITGIYQLDLVVEDAGDGQSNDWGVWLSPTLAR